MPGSVLLTEEQYPIKSKISTTLSEAIVATMPHTEAQLVPMVCRSDPGSGRSLDTSRIQSLFSRLERADRSGVIKSYTDDKIILQRLFYSVSRFKRHCPRGQRRPE